MEQTINTYITDPAIRINDTGEVFHLPYNLSRRPHSRTYTNLRGGKTIRQT